MLNLYGMEFKLVSKFTPKGDQPQAIEKLVEGIENGYRFQTLLGVTGSGKTFTIANVIERVQKPTLVISHNKTLAAQLYGEYKGFFPHNAVEYFISYYDYYQPEAYVPEMDLYIEKEASINEEIEKYRLRATSALIERRDVIVVASVSCLYGIGSREDYEQMMVCIRVGDTIERDDFLQKLVNIQYVRNDVNLDRGAYRVRGDVVEIHPAYEDYGIQVEFWGDEIDRISTFDLTTGKIKENRESIVIYPAKHYVIPPDRIERAIEGILKELEERVAWFRAQGKLLEAQRLETRTKYDIEMLREVGYCPGVENYSRYLSGRAPGERPYTIIDFFPKDYLIIIDESHVTVPQLMAMYRGDRSRKETLVEYGFRLPSALDNRPLKFEEFLELANQIIFVSATPGPFELEHSEQVVEQIVRPTGLVDPKITVKPTKGQIDDLINEIQKRVEKGQKTIVTTLTKRMAEDLAEFLQDMGIKVQYLHSEVEPIDRVKILRALRLGEIDCLVGVNLLREGLDLPEVSLVAILDADKEGFLRSTTTLIQVAGRAARNVDGEVIMYADELTESMKKAIEETNRRREIQLEYNRKHGITPKTIYKTREEILATTRVAGEQVSEEETEFDVDKLEFESELEKLEFIKKLEKQMRELANEWKFEEAAKLRDIIKKLKGEPTIRVHHTKKGKPKYKAYLRKKRKERKRR